MAILVRGPCVSLAVGGALCFGSSLHDGTCEATALLQQGEACLSEG